MDNEKKVYYSEEVIEALKRNMQMSPETLAALAFHAPLRDCDCEDGENERNKSV